jgi:Ca2+-binding RTX toxin-like protein
MDEFTYTVTDVGGLSSGLITVKVAVTEAGDNRFVRGTVRGDLFIDAVGKDTTYLAGSGHDVVSGKDGSDLLFGQLGNDELNGGDGRDYLGGGLGENLLTGGAGSDTLLLGFGDEPCNRLQSGRRPDPETCKFGIRDQSRLLRTK